MRLGACITAEPDMIGHSLFVPVLALSHLVAKEVWILATLARAQYVRAV